MSGFIEQFYYGNIEPQARGTRTNEAMSGDMLFRLIKKMAERQGVTEQVKATDFIGS